ncbi:CBS domain-containing protein [Streptomyces sp. NPDC058326]|uniref:CBS domain-containing protein n=1 Tax=Streptomyces sp. NPDC058326 TaxID=3346447 RepID=UPI0036EA4F87
MRAYELVEPYPSVSADDDAVTAARLFVEHRLPALLVLDGDQRPYAIVPGSQLLKVMVPEFVVQDPTLAGALRGGDAESFTEQLRGLTVAQWLPQHRTMPTVVGPDATALEIAAVMARTHTPLVAVVMADGEGVRTAGAITAARLMEHFLTVP